MSHDEDQTDDDWPLPFYWPQMSEDERIIYYGTLGNRLLDHRYRYYILDAPVLDDWTYDAIERLYKLVAVTLDLPDTTANMVGFDLKRLDSKEAKARVDTETDDYSLHMAKMHEVWARIGPPRYERKKSQDKKPVA